MLSHTPCSTDIRNAAGPTKICCICNRAALCTRWHKSNCPPAVTSEGQAHTAPTQPPSVHAHRKKQLQQFQAPAVATSPMQHTHWHNSRATKGRDPDSLQLKAVKVRRTGTAAQRTSIHKPDCAVMPLTLVSTHTHTNRMLILPAAHNCSLPAPAAAATACVQAYIPQHKPPTVEQANRCCGLPNHIASKLCGTHTCCYTAGCWPGLQLNSRTMHCMLDATVAA